MFEVAEALGKFRWEVAQQMPVAELFGWQAFWKLRAAAERAAKKQAEKDIRNKPRKHR